MGFEDRHAQLVAQQAIDRIKEKPLSPAKPQTPEEAKQAEIDVGRAIKQGITVQSAISNRPLFDEHDRRELVKQSLYLATDDIKKTPDDMIGSVSSYFGVPAHVAERDDGRMARMMIAELNAEKVKSPVVEDAVIKRQIQSNDIKAGILPKMEELGRWFSDTATETKSSFLRSRKNDINFNAFVLGNGLSPEQEAEIASIDKAISGAPTDTDIYGVVGSAIKTTVGQVPVYGRTLTGAVLGGAAGAGVGFATGGTALIPSAILGAEIGGAGATFTLTAGEAATQLSSVRGPEGERLHPDIVKIASITAGGLNAGLEMLPVLKLAKMANIDSQVAKKLKETLAKNKIKKQAGEEVEVKNFFRVPAIQNRLLKISAEYTVLMAVEGGTEAAQTFLLNAIQNIAALAQGEEELQTDLMEGVGESFTAGMEVAAVTGLVGVGANIRNQQKKIKQGREILGKGREFLADPAFSGLADKKTLLDSISSGKNIYLSGDAYVEFFQSLDDATLAKFIEAVPDAKQKYEDVLQEGGTVELSLGEYVTGVQAFDQSGKMDDFASENPYVPNASDFNDLVAALKSAEDKALTDPNAVFEQFPELKGMFEDDITDADYSKLEAALIEASKVRGAPFSAKQAQTSIELISNIVQTARERSSDQTISTQDREIIASLVGRHFLNLDIKRASPSVDIGATGIDDLIDKARQREANRARQAKIEAERPRDILGDKKQKRSPIIKGPKHVTEALSAIGIRIDEDKGIQRFKESGTGLDNISFEEFSDALSHAQIFPKREGDSYYVDPAWLIEQVDLESRGMGIRSEAENIAEQEEEHLDDFLSTLSMLDLDVSAPRAEIKSAIAKYLKDREKGVDFEQATRGRAVFTPSGRTIIELMKDADLSTFIHEVGGHVGLRFLRDAAETTNIQHYKDAWDTILKWWDDNNAALYKEAKRYNPYKVVKKSKAYFSVVHNGEEIAFASTQKEAKEKSSALHKDAIKKLDAAGGKKFVEGFKKSTRWEDASEIETMILIAQDEFFARAFEAYILEGAAPSVGLKRAMNLMSTWIKRIYGSVKNLNVPISDDIRGVFDRLLATDEAIESARQMDAFKPDPRIMEMLSKAQKERYIRDMQDQERMAKEKTFSILSKEKEREATVRWKERKKEIEKKIGVHLTKAEKAAYFLQAGEMPDGAEIERGAFKLSKKEVEENFVGAKLDPRMLSDDGISITEAAIVLGYESDVAFISDLKKAGNMTTKVGAKVDQVMRKLFGDKLANVAEMVVRDMTEFEYDRLVSLEMKATGYAGDEFVFRDNIRLAAVHKMRGMTMRAAMSTGKFFSAINTNARKAGIALGKKNLEDFSVQKRKQLFSIYMFKEGEFIKTEYAKAMKMFSRLLAPPKKGAVLIDNEYHDTIRRVISTVMGIGKHPKIDTKELADTLKRFMDEDLEDFVSWIDENGNMQESISLSLEKGGIKNLTVTEFKDVINLIKNITAAGRRKREGTLSGENVTRQERILELIEQAKKVTKPRKFGAPEKRGTGFFAVQIQASARMNVLDGGHKDGVWHNTIYRPIAQAARHEAVRNREVSRKFSEIAESIYTIKERIAIGGGVFPALQQALGEKIGEKISPKRTFIESIGISLTKEEMLMVLLNYGNDGNRDHLRNAGIGQDVISLTDDQIMDILSNLEEKDFQFADKIWELVGSFNDEKKKVEIRTKGFTSEDVQAAPFTVTLKNGKTVNAKGGYFPVDFDYSVTREGAKQKEDEQKFARTASAMVRKRFTESRVGAPRRGGLPIKLSFYTITKNLHDQIHYIESYEAINNVEKYLKNSNVKQAIKDRFGLDGFESLDLWIKDAATGTIAASGFFEKLHSYFRTNMIVSTMGASFSVIASQPTGAILAIPELGGGIKGTKALMRGYAEYLRMSANKPPLYMLEEIYKRSAFLKTRHDTVVRELRENSDIWKSLPEQWLSNSTKFWMAPVLYMQIATVDVPVYIAAEIQYRENHPNATEAEIVAYAEDIVSRSQSSSELHAMSGIMRGTDSRVVQSQWIKTMTIALGYFNNKVNRVYEISQSEKMRNGTSSERMSAATNMAIYLWLDSFIVDLLFNRLPNYWPDDAEDEDFTDIMSQWAWWFAARPLDLFVLFREFAATMSGRKVDTPLYKILDNLSRAKTQIQQGEADVAATKAVVAATSSFVRIPATQTNRFIELYKQHDEGNIENVRDIIDVLVGTPLDK